MTKQIHTIQSFYENGQLKSVNNINDEDGSVKEVKEY